MEDTDYNTYAVIVAESGEAQVFRCGSIDHSHNSHQPGSVLRDVNMARDSPDVISKESSHKVEEPSVKDCDLGAEIESPHTAAGRQKESLVRARMREDDKLPNGKILNRSRYGDRKTILADAGRVDEKGEDCSLTKFYWSTAMTRALVDGYRTLAVEFRRPEKRQRDVWESLAEEMRRKGYADVTWNMCDRKWRNLKNTFKTIYYSNRPVESKRRWEFYDEFKVLFAPDVRGKRVERKSRTISPRVSFQSRGDFTRNMENSAERGDLAATLKQPRWFSEFSDLYRNRYRTKLELARQRHNRRIMVTRRTCELLERLVDSI